MVHSPVMRHIRFACLLPWMATAAAWGSPILSAPAAQPQVDFGYKGVLSGEAIRVGEECYGTLDLLAKAGLSPQLRGLDCQVMEDGRTFTVPVYSMLGKQMVSLNEVAKELQAKAYFGRNSDTFYVKASLQEVSATATGVLLRTSMSVKPTITQTQNPPRLTIDLKGCEYEPLMGRNLPSGWKLSYTGLDVVRLSIDHPTMAYFNAPRISEGRAIKLTLPEQVMRAAGLAQAPLTTPTTSPSGVTVPNTEWGGGGSVQIRPAGGYTSPFGGYESDISPPTGTIGTLGDVSIQANDDDVLTLQIPSSSLARGSVAAKYAGPNQVVVTFSNAAWARGGDFTPQTRLASAIQRVITSRNSELRITTLVPLVFSISNSEQFTTVRLTRPKAGGLSRKVIVVDPGHGGHDTGCRYGSLYEKNMTLAIGLVAAQAIQREGASVILTRDDDSYPSLTRRRELANEANADAFISIHINSLNGSAPQACMTFYHGRSAQGNLLAECIQAELAKVTTIPSWGTVNDLKRFRTGLAVLNGNRSPGVLMELGFINNAADRAEMISADYPERVSLAIVRGLKRFFGERM